MHQASLQIINRFKETLKGGFYRLKILFSIKNQTLIFEITLHIYQIILLYGQLRLTYGSTKMFIFECITYTRFTETPDFAAVSSKEFLDIQAIIECGFTLKRVRDMTKRYSQMHRADKYSENSTIILSVWPNG